LKASSLDNETRLSEVARKLKDALRAKPSEWEIHVPVLGLERGYLPKQFGKVSFYVVDETTVKEKIAAAIETNAWPFATKEEAKNRFWDAGVKELNGWIMGVVATMAVDSEAANALAIREVRQTLDVINFFASWRHPFNSKAALPWESNLSQPAYLRLKKGGDLSYGVKWELKGPIQMISLPQLEETPGFLRISAIRNRLQVSN